MFKNKRNDYPRQRFTTNRNDRIEPAKEFLKYLKPYISHDIRVTNLSNDKILVEISEYNNKVEIFRWNKGTEGSRFQSIIKYGYPTSSQKLQEIIKYLKDKQLIGVQS